MDSGTGTHGEVFDHRSPKRPGADAGRELVPEAAPWADIQPDMLRLVLRLLPCFADRAGVRSVCHHWRAIACSHGVAPPLPLLMLPKLRFSIFSSDGALTAVRRLPLPKELVADGVRWMGSFQGWLVGVQPSKYCRGADGKCFLLNAFSHKVVHLPHLSAFNFFNYSCYTTSTLRIINGSGVLHCLVSAREYTMSFHNVVLSASPDSGSKCIVAATSGMDTTKLALWRQGMRSWCVCKADCFAGRNDLAFYQGKLYMLSRSTLCLLAFEIEEDDRGVMVSHVEQCMVELRGCVDPIGKNYNLVEWRGKLLVIIRYSTTTTPDDERNILQVKVFSLDFSTNPCALSQIHSLDGECIFVDSCSSRSFPADLYDGVQGDIIYFLDDHNYYACFDPSYDTFVYNMRDGTVTPFAVELSPGNFGAPEDNLAHPVWFFPSK
ncbi:unnamed protein product [Alopecurus aequalis]